MSHEKINYEFHAISADKTFSAISNGDALVKTLCSPIDPIDKQSWHELLQQIADPKNKRIVREVDEDKIDRSRVYNPKTGTWSTRNLKPKRGLPKQTIFTKKSPTTLLPADGVIDLFQPVNPRYRANIGIIFDLNFCDLKDEKYIFKQNQNTHQRWWLKRKGERETQHRVARSISLQKLKKYLSAVRKKNKIPEQNEILAGLSRGAVRGVFTRKDSLEERLNSIAKKALILEYLNLDVPIFILSPSTELCEYTVEEQYKDISTVLNQNHKFYRQIVDSIPENLIKRIKQESSSKKYFHVNPLAKLPPEVFVNVIDNLAQDDIGAIYNFSKLTEKYNEYSHLNQFNYKKSFEHLLAICNERRVQLKINKKQTDYKKLYIETIQNNYCLLSSLIVNRQNVLKNQKQVNDVITHISSVNPKSLNLILDQLLMMNSSIYDNTILYLLQKGAKPSRNYLTETIGWREDTSWDSERKIAKEIKYWSFFIKRLIDNDNEVLLQAILHYLPEHVGFILKSLESFHKTIITESSFKYDYSLEKIAKLRIYFLDALESKHHYTASYDDKRFFEKHLLDKIANIEGKEALLNFSQRYKNSFIVNQQRNPKFDKLRFALFARDPMPAIKRNVLNAIELKFENLAATTTIRDYIQPVL